MLVGCAGSSQPTSEPAPEPEEACTRGKLETDLVFAPLAGPGVDPATGTLVPPPAAGYVVSSTYLALLPEPAAQAQFQGLVNAIVGELQQQPGLVAFQLASSMSCGTARTVTVWRDEPAMFAFVAGPAHGNARAAVREVSRGGSAVTSWEAVGLEQTTWQYAAEQLAATDPIY